MSYRKQQQEALKCTGPTREGRTTATTTNSYPYRTRQSQKTEGCIAVVLELCEFAIVTNLLLAIS
jgi:hypothetical protein